MDYESAHDLPTFMELTKRAKSLSMLRFFTPRGRRVDVRELQRQIQYLGDTVDRFYEVLGPRNWIFHDTLPVDAIAELLTARPEPEEVEAGLINIYNDSLTMAIMVRSMNDLPAMVKRMPLIRKAEEDFFSGRYYACIHVLLSVMDGFVNEFETVRRGLHAREAEELKAWDSVVGHHMGLTNAHRTFTKGKSTTNEEPVTELYRNGIVHGSILNYDNVVVASKAWNRLFAVADWVKSTLRQKLLTPEKVTWKATIAQIVANDAMKRALEAWEPSRLDLGDDGFTEHAATRAASAFLSLWTRKNYGQMARSIALKTAAPHGTGMPALVKLEYRDYLLTSFEIKSIDHSAAAICEVVAALVLEDDTQRIVQLRWLYEDDNGDPVVPPSPGTWRLLRWDPTSFMIANQVGESDEDGFE